MDPSHIISVSQFDPERIARLFARVREMREIVNRKRPRCSTLEGFIMGTVFYEASTRTRFSFEAAMLRLGGDVITTENAREFSSVSKGESLPDSIRTMGCYLDLIVLRHFTDGAAVIAAQASPVPVINGGDGDGEHPTQALLDLFTILERFPNKKNLTVVFVGDLKYGRTVHSLAQLLGLYRIHIRFVSPQALCLPTPQRDELMRMECDLSEHQRLAEVIHEADVLYMTRVQKERLNGEQGVQTDGCDYALTRELVGYMKDTAIVMHPLPRNAELPTWFDADPRAAYFQEAQNGLYVRMALLEELLNPFPG